jgi:MFS family permease
MKLILKPTRQNMFYPLIISIKCGNELKLRGISKIHEPYTNGKFINVTEAFMASSRTFMLHNFNMSNFQDGEFDWDEEIQGYILSAYYYGYVATQLLGGRLSEMFGSKVILGPRVLISGIMSLLYPVAARLHVGAFIAARVLTGAAYVVLHIVQCFT